MRRGVGSVEPRALAAMRRGRVLPILRLRDHGRAVEIAETLVGAGVQALEITLGEPAAHGSIAAVVKAVGERVPVGAGTVLDREEPRRLADLGVEFCVSPHADPALVESVLAAGLVPLPGTYTATEVTVARAAGAPAVKLFPAGPAGTGHLRALLGPFPDLAVVPTGGIAIGEIPAWLAAGAIAVGLGSDLVPPSGSLDGLQERAVRAVRLATQM
jgi:2-dehydro-3-deoxyphosphogluconate aldolase / (4S)-4-hydroxy-2-oxoglutarate aldolase